MPFSTSGSCVLHSEAEGHSLWAWTWVYPKVCLTPSHKATLSFMSASTASAQMGRRPLTRAGLVRRPQVTGQGRSRVRAANQNLPPGREASSPDGSPGEAASARELAQRRLQSPDQPAPTGANGRSEALYARVHCIAFYCLCTHTHTHDFTLKQTLNKG